MNLLYPYKDCFDVLEQQHREYIAMDKKKNSRSKYRIRNYSKKVVSKIKADSESCINIEGVCDFIFTVGQTKLVEEYYLVELKDSDLIEAVRQLDRSITKFGLNKEKINARAVLTKTYAPDVRDNNVLKFKRKIELGGGTFKHKSQYLEDII